MRHNLKAVAVSALAIVAALALSIPAYASDKKISEVKFRVNSTPEAGDGIGTPDVAITKGNAEITEQEYDNDDDEWERGDKPVIYLTIEADDGYYFSSTTLSMTKSSYKVSKRSGNKSTWKVKITLTAIGGDLDTIEDVYWNNRTAKWDEVSDASKYEVKLYRNSSTVTTITTTNNSYNFYQYMTKSGDYTFKVRAIDGSDKSDWSDESDECYISASEVYTGAVTTTDSTSDGTTPGNTGTESGQWVNSAYGWSYYVNGVPVKGNWVYSGNEWYHINANGFMDTGWIFVDNNWFYLNPISDGTMGKMLTGWQQIGTAKYYLNPVSDGTRGARKTSYQNIDGNWYLLDPTTGALWTNAITPNGMVADANGVLH